MVLTLGRAEMKARGPHTLGQRIAGSHVALAEGAAIADDDGRTCAHLLGNR